MPIHSVLLSIITMPLQYVYWPLARPIHEKIMKRSTPTVEDANALRSRAEAQTRLNPPAASPAEWDALALVHELQVHQIELEMQNEELRRSQEQLRGMEARYRELYDFAPVGYIVLDAVGDILDLNLAGAEVVGIGRAELLQKRFSLFLAPESLNSFAAMNAEARKSRVKQCCELAIARPDGEIRFVQAEAIVSDGVKYPGEQLHLVLPDITARKLAEQTLHSHFQIITDKLGALTGVLDLEAFLSQTLTVIAEHDRSMRASFWLTDDTTENIVLHSLYQDGAILSAAKSDHSLASTPVALASLSFWPAMHRTRQPIVLRDSVKAPNYPMFDPVPTGGPDRTLLLVPLIIGNAAIGLVCLHSPGIRIYSPLEIQFTQAIAQQVTLAVHMAMLGEKAQNVATERERNRLAQEIHDTIAQGLTGISVQLEVAEDALEDAPGKTRMYLQKARELARTSLAEVRRSVRALRPAALDGASLAGALELELARRSAGTGIRTLLMVNGDVRSLSEEIEANLLRMAQEAVTNALNHSQAQTIRIELSYGASKIRLDIQDDGCGFDIGAAAEDPTRFGLKIMRERAVGIGAVLEITSSPSKGTRVNVSCAGELSYTA